MPSPQSDSHRQRPRRQRARLAALLIPAAVLFVTAFAQISVPPASEGATLTTPKAIVLGVVEGVTEYLPISSTGHLLITEKILGIGETAADKDAADTYTVVIQIGAILAVLGIFRDRFLLMFKGITSKDEQGRSLILSLLLAFIPAVLIALLFQDPIKERLLAPWPVVGAWVVGALAIFAFVANNHRFIARFESVGTIPPKVALGIGCAQVLALWPGTSRSLVTILAAVLLGCSLRVAVEFSFLLGFLTLSAATGYELLKNGSTLLDTFGLMNPVIGILAAGVSAFVSVKWMITYLEKHPLTIFGGYRIAAAAVTAVLLATGTI
jgi:undecaprenyl-diphosphatase